MAGELRNEALRHVLGDVAAKLLASGFIGLCWGGFPNSTSPKTLAFQNGRRGVPCQESGLGFRGIFGTVARNPKRCQDRTPNRCRLAVSCAGSLLMLLCAQVTAPWCFLLFLLDALNWKENVMQARTYMPPPRPNREQWLASWSKISKLHARCYRNWLCSPQKAA